MATDKPKTPQVFLCHANEDKARVTELYGLLKKEGVKPWLDKKDLLPGQTWSREILRAIKKSTFVLIFFSKTSIAKRGYVQKEFKMALDVLDEIPDDHIFIIPVRLDDCRVPERFSHLHYCDIFEDGGFEQIIKAIKSQTTIDHATPKYNFRSSPTVLFYDDVQAMLEKHDFYDEYENATGRGIANNFEPKGKVVFDAATGLTWQQPGSSQSMRMDKAGLYIQKLINEKYAGYSDWRLPTLEEAMSLMEPEKNAEGRYINPVFDETQSWILTSDKSTASRAWLVGFSSGGCFNVIVVSSLFVRAVR